MWLYQTKVGMFWIRFSPQGGGRYLLGIDDSVLGVYHSPEAASDDVYMRRTGWPPWDSLSSSQKPSDLTEWTRRDCRV